MKPGLAILPLEVWADVSEHPLITRELLARIADNNGDPDFTDKLQKLLHGCGKQTLHYMNIFLNECGEPQNRPCMKVAYYRRDPEQDCEFPPEVPMPENIKGFKQLTIGHFDDDVLGFLHKIRPLFTNVHLKEVRASNPNGRTVLAHLLPMLGGIRGIHCGNKEIPALEQHFPGTLVRAKELIIDSALAYIPALLDWLNTPLDFAVHGPRFLKCNARTFKSKPIKSIIDAVRQQFLTATTRSAFVIYIEHYLSRHVAEERTDPNATTNEQLSVRNAVFKAPMNREKIRYVEIMRYPVGAEANMREWVKQRAYFEQYVKWLHTRDEIDGEEQMIWIGSPWNGSPSIGPISDQYKARAVDQAEDQPAAGGAEEDQTAGRPSTLAVVDGNEGGGGQLETSSSSSATMTASSSSLSSSSGDSSSSSETETQSSSDSSDSEYDTED